MKLAEPWPERVQKITLLLWFPYGTLDARKGSVLGIAPGSAYCVCHKRFLASVHGVPGFIVRGGTEQV